MSEELRYAFCQPTGASPVPPWHLRKLTAVGYKPGGSIDTPSLCDDVRKWRGWDLLIVVTERHLGKNTCRKCLAIYRQQTL